MMRITEHYNFNDLELKVSGNIAVTKVAGFCSWTLNENGGSFELFRVNELYLKAVDDGLIQIDLISESIAAPVIEALAKAARTLTNRGREPDPFPVADPAELTPTPLDSADPEGAKHTTD